MKMQNNEAEALRSWRSALDQIYYHNAYRMPTSWVPKTETERALQDSLKQLEMQCKERVDLLTALKESRDEAGKDSGKEDKSRRKHRNGKTAESPAMDRQTSWLGEGTVPPVSYPDLSKPTPPLPARPSLYTSRSSESIKGRTNSTPNLQPYSSPLSAAPNLAVPTKSNISRSPSPDHNRKTMRTTLRSSDKRGFRSPRTSASQQPKPQAAMKAAGLSWDTRTSSFARPAKPDHDRTIEARLSATAARRSLDITPVSTNEADPRHNEPVKMPSPTDYIPSSHWREPSDSRTKAYEPSLLDEPLEDMHISSDTRQPSSAMDDLFELETPLPPPIPPHATAPLNPLTSKTRRRSPPPIPQPPEISYRKEYPRPAVRKMPPATSAKKSDSESQQDLAPTSGIIRKPVANSSTPRGGRSRPSRQQAETSSGSGDDERAGQSGVPAPPKARRARPTRNESKDAVTPPSTDADSHEEGSEKAAWDAKVQKLMKNLPKGVDEGAAKQIFNEIVVHGDEVHWDDVAGLDGAKKALKEAVVYPFLRPDLFMGLREPARGMLLFGPPGTGKTMLARAVATESKSTFFAISASSLTSKWHGESEKLVRALFAIAKLLAPSIIFVDEIDSLLSARSSSSEHEASRRSKTEFLIQWSDLQRAAAGRDTHAKGETGDPTRVLVLAATNVPWDIDEAARRRFVRRQYIPLPEAETRETQLRTLLGHQKHTLSAKDIWKLVSFTEGVYRAFAEVIRPG